MTDNETLSAIFKLVESQAKHVEEIPQINTRLAVIEEKVEKAESRLSQLPDKNEMKLEILTRRQLTGKQIAAIISAGGIALAGVISACAGVFG